MENEFRVSGSSESIAAFLNSAIKSSTGVIEHYDFVINDISSTISDPKLEATKGPTIEFLKEMCGKWVNFRKNAEEKLKEL